MKKILISLIISFATFSIAFAQGDAMIKTTVALTGNVFNHVTKLPETVKIKVTDQAGERVAITRSTASDNGSYYITGLKPGKTYNVAINKRDFMKEVFVLTVPNTNKYLELSHDFMIKPLEKGVQIKISVPPFEINKSKLRVGSDYFLEEIKDALLENENVNFTIVCFPDKDKNSNNSKLTKDRASSLKKYFIANGLSASRIKIQGSAKTDPKDPPPTKRASKGKRYIGTSYIQIDSF